MKLGMLRLAQDCRNSRDLGRDGCWEILYAPGSRFTGLPAGLEEGMLLRGGGLVRLPRGPAEGHNTLCVQVVYAKAKVKPAHQGTQKNAREACARWANGAKLGSSHHTHTHTESKHLITAKPWT